ncbi:hypothetical protein FRB96_004894 [Tulasnella sp. 330]|nr:hypothetical protein FRB96_004894 [Tulasnella sp. 330]
MSTTTISTHPKEPSLTFHPDHGAKIVLPAVPDMEVLAGGAPFNAIANDEKQLEDRGSLKRTHKHLDSSDVWLEGVLECYCCRPSIEIFRRSWREDSEFEDNAFVCKGYTQTAAQYYAMSQEYTIRFVGAGLVVTSLITLDLNENDKIVKLADKWSGNDLHSRYGAYYLRRLGGKSVPWFISVPKYRFQLYDHVLYRFK